jgi:hypothetical protein
LEHINGINPLIFKEIWVFPDLTGIYPFIFENKVLAHPASVDSIPTSAENVLK